MTGLRVMLVDDDATVRDTLPELLEGQADLTVAPVLPDGRTALGWLRREELADLVLLDVDMPGLDGITTARVIRREFPGVAVVMLTAFRHDDFLDRALAAGAQGFLMKAMPPEDLARAVVDAAHGQTVMAPRATELLATAARERQIRREAGREFVDAARELPPSLRGVFDLLTVASSTDLICEQLRLSPRTVRSYVSEILQRMGSHSREELVLRAAQTGLTRPPRPDAPITPRRTP